MEHSKTSSSSLQQVYTIASGHLFHDLYTSFLAPLLPKIIESYSLSLTSAGILTTLSRLPSVLNPFIGYIFDKTGAKYFVILTPGITATIMCLLGVAPNVYVLGLLVFLAGTSSTIFHASTPGMVAGASTENKGLGLSVYMAGGGLGRTLGPLLVVWGVAQWGLTGLFRLAFVGWFSSLFLFFRFRNIELSPRKGFSITSIMPLLKSFFMPVALVLLLRNTLTASLYTYLPVYMVQSGAPLWMAGLSLSTLEISGVTGALILGPLSDKIGRRKSINISMIVSAVTMLLFIQVSGLLVIPFLIVLGFFSLSTSTLFLALVQDHFQEHRATGNGIYLLIHLLANGLMLILIGKIGDIASLRAAYYLSAAAAILSIPALRLIPRKVTT
jgi:FSR family fosmidomycin resistance protein-like MFS transporter